MYKNLHASFCVLSVVLAFVSIVEAQTINTVAGNGTSVFSGDGLPSISAGVFANLGTVDAAGNLYIAGQGRVRKISPSGIISTVAGIGSLDGSWQFNGDGGLATLAGVDPKDVAVDVMGNLYIADFLNNRIRKVTPAGIISTVAGNGVSGFSGDGGPATSASLRNPVSVALDVEGNLYIVDEFNYRIRKVTVGGVISTVAGNGMVGSSGDGAPATAASFALPYDVAVDAAGNLFIADFNGQRIRKVTSNGIISTFAGNGAQSFSGDGGPATSASLNNPSGVVVDKTGNVFIADSQNYRIRNTTVAGIISTVAGTGTKGFSGDSGPALLAQFNDPQGVALDGSGNLFIADSGNYRIRMVTGISPIVILTSANPVFAVQGTRVPVTLIGAGFDAGLTVDAGNGIQVSNILSTNGTSATAIFEIGADASPGIRNITLTTSGGATSNAVPFTVIANHAPVAVSDSFRVDKAGTLNVPAPGVLDNDTDLDNNPLTALLMTSPLYGSVNFNADGSFSYSHYGGDVTSDSFTYRINDGVADSNLATVKLSIEGLLVNHFEATSSGFVAEFNHPVDATVLNLYSTETNGLGPQDVTLVGATGGAVRGSLVVFNNGGSVTFVRTGGVLPPDTYTATLRSAVDGFRSPSVGLLDGNHDGIAGDNYSETFTISNYSAVISVPDFVKGAGEDVNLSGRGIPLTLSEGAGVTQADLILKYDPSLLAISQVAAGAGLPSGSQVQVDFSLSDRVHVTVTSASPLGAGSTELLRIIAQVPGTAPYRASEVLSLTSLSLNGGAIPVIGDDGIHVATFLGDTTGDGSFSSLDVQRMLRVISGIDSGFAAFGKIDPVIIGDITGNGILSSLDATRLFQEILGINRP